MINDNSNDQNWPESKIIKAESIPNNMHDMEPYAQKLTLSCGHWLINTFGIAFAKKHEGELLRCRTCGEKK